MADEKALVNEGIRLLQGLETQELAVLSIGRPKSVDHAANIGLIISKLSPIVANLLEFEFAAYLNASGKWPPGARWERQDPDFPDLALRSGAETLAGIEIKAWFPFSTEITGRFKESQRRLASRHYQVMVVAWLPEFLLHGGPRIIDTWTDSGLEMAKSRDKKYHQPPRYLVVEPEDTSDRTRNLQQTTCAGYVHQGDPSELQRAAAELASWPRGLEFTSPEYQARLRSLMGTYTYRLDTNFAKIDRIEHDSLESFKSKVLQTEIHGRTIAEWRDGIAAQNATVLKDITLLGGPDAPKPRRKIDEFF